MLSQNKGEVGSGGESGMGKNANSGIPGSIMLLLTNRDEASSSQLLDHAGCFCN